MLDLLQGIRIISFNHFLLGPMGIQASGWQTSAPT